MSEVHKITIKQKGSGESIMTGANTEIYIDGVLLKDAYKVTFTSEAGQVAKVVIEMYGNVEIEGNIDTSIRVFEIK